MEGKSLHENVPPVRMQYDNVNFTTYQTHKFKIISNSLVLQLKGV